MARKSFAFIKDVDFMFENTPVKVVANRNCPEIGLAGLNAGPFEEGKEYEIKFWVGRELEAAGIARFREEETLDAVKLHKAHWKERVQAAMQLSSLPEDFYPKLRRFLADSRRAAMHNPEKVKEHEKAASISQDILNCRLKKIVSLASAPAQTDQTLQSLAREERVLYERLYTIVSEWKSQILKAEDES